MPTAMTPTCSDARAAMSTRENTSRPRSSVPNQWSRLGAANRLRISCSLAPYGANAGPKIAASTSRASTTSPNTARRLATSADHTSARRLRSGAVIAPPSNVPGSGGC